jgi:hypothetical protein
MSQADVPRNIGELIESVKNSYAQYSPEILNKIWLSHQQAMTDTLISRGNNVYYKLGHLQKDKLIREGRLPDALGISMDLYNKSIQYHLENGIAV